MEDNEKIVAPEEEIKATESEEVEVEAETAASDPAKEEAKVEENSAEIETDDDEDDLDTDEPDYEDRIEALEGKMEEFNDRFDYLADEQEKIVTVLEKISDKVLEKPSRPTKQEEKNSLESEGKEETEPEEAPQAEESESTSEEDIAVENAVETEEEPKEETESEEPDSTTGEPTEEASEEKSAEDSEEEPEKAVNNKKENEMTKEELQEILNSFKADVVNEILDKKVEEPEVKEAPAEEAKEEPEVAQNWRQRYNDQVAAAWDYHRLNNIEAGEKLRKINQYNADLKVKNDAGTAPMTITSLAEFVLPPEMDREIHGLRTNYTPFLNAVNYQQTNNLQFMYSTRVGDIDMQNVALCDDGADGNLKPVETYELKRGIAQMEELAAVTPICDNATKYMAVDILQDVAEGYRNDYDRKLAQLAIVRFQQALNETGNTVEYDPATAVDSLVDFVKATTLVSEGVVNGKFVFNARTKALILENLLRSGNDGLGQTAFTTGDTQTIWGYDYIVVPNDLMPTLGSNEVKTFKALNNATGVLESVDITTPVIYGDLDAYRGKVGGGLNYTVSTEASYEINGTVFSAYQRNEMVIRGAFTRGGYLADPTVIAGLAPVTSS